MDEIWERALQTALNGETDCESVTTLTLDGAVKCFQARFPPPALLEKFCNLEHLSIANAGVSSLDNFPCLPKLQKLVLSDNRIAGGLEHLVQAGLESLRDLDLSNNRLQYMEDLVPLAQLKLVSLDLYECPVTKIQDYRIRVFGLIRSLKYLDKMDADGNERPESDDEEDDDEEDEDDEEEEYDPGSGEVDGEGKLTKGNNGASADADGVLDADEGEESDADEEEREVLTVGDVSNGSLDHHSNGFRVASSREVDVDVVDVDEEDEDDDDEDNLGEEIDEEDEDVLEVHEIDDSDDGDEIEGEDDDEDDDDEDDDDVDDVDEVDDEEEDVEPASAGRLTSTEGEIDGHDHGEEDENGEIGEEEELSSEDGNAEDDIEDEDGTGYRVQPIGDAEEDVGGSDFDEGDQDGESGEEEIDDVRVQAGDLQSHPSSSSSQVKRKRNEEAEDVDNNDDDDEGVQNGDPQLLPSTSSVKPKKKRN